MVAVCAEQLTSAGRGWLLTSVRGGGLLVLMGYGRLPASEAVDRLLMSMGGGGLMTSAGVGRMLPSARNELAG